MPQSIATLTLNPAVDKSSQVESVAAEIKLRCDAPTFDPGGGGINVARAVHKLGGQALAIYTAGGGPGQMLRTLLEKENIPCQPIAIADYTRESLTIFERSTTLQYRFGMPGPHLSEDEWRASLNAFINSEATWLVASGSLPPGVPTDAYAQLARDLRHRGKRLIVDTSGPALEQLRGSGAYLIKPNLHELEILSGKKFEGEAQMLDVARQLIAEAFAEVLIISLGAAGAALVTAGQFVRFRPPVVPIQSKVGAGDSMVGGIVWALAQEHDLVSAARYGVAAGTAAVMTPGTELCRRHDAEYIYEHTLVIA